MDRQQDVIRRITAHIVAYRFQLENERRRNMSRLTEKLALAAAVAPRQAAKIEARADAIIAREQDIEHQTDQSFLPHELLLDEAENGLSALEKELRLMSNNPPLEHSTPLPAAAGAEPKLYPDSAFTHVERVALGPHPDQPEGMNTALKTLVIGDVAKEYAEGVEQAGIATFRAAE